MTRQIQQVLAHARPRISPTRNTFLRDAAGTCLGSLVLEDEAGAFSLLVTVAFNDIGLCLSDVEGVGLSTPR